MASSSSPISPTKLRCDLYEFRSHDDPPTTPLVVSVLPSLLERAISRNERSVLKFGDPWTPSKDPRIRAFESDRILDMTIQSFLERIFRYTHIPPSVYVVAYAYIDRLCHINPELRISSTNVHRILITTIMVASKFVEDLNYKNSYFAKVGGLEAEELNKLELDFLFLMGFRLHVSVSVFESYCKHLEREVSFGGGYHIERCLRFMCGDQDITPKERERRLSHLPRIL